MPMGLDKYTSNGTISAVKQIIDFLVRFQGKTTDTEFSRKIGITRKSWNRIRNQQLSMNLATLKKVTMAFPENQELRDIVDIFLYGNGTYSTLSEDNLTLKNQRCRALPSSLKGLVKWIRNRA